jgi:hypothetical protein
MHTKVELSTHINDLWAAPSPKFALLLRPRRRLAFAFTDVLPSPRPICLGIDSFIRAARLGSFLHLPPPRHRLPAHPPMNVLEHWHAPPASRPRRQALRYLRRHLWLLHRTKRLYLPQTHMEAKTNRIVRFQCHEAILHHRQFHFPSFCRRRDSTPPRARLFRDTATPTPARKKFTPLVPLSPRLSLCILRPDTPTASKNSAKTGPASA